MKIALCFSGQIRTGALSAPNILRYIGDLLPDCDIFVHTWDTETKGTGYANRVGEGLRSTQEEWHDAKPVENSTVFDQFAEIMKPKRMVIEEYDLEPTKKLWGGRRFCTETGKWYVSMWYSVFKANQLKMEYAAQNGVFYDYTIRIRPDIVFGPEKSLAEDLELIENDSTLVFGDHYHIWDFDGRQRCEDIFFIGSSRVMDHITCYHECYTNTVSNIDDPSLPGYEDWQWHFCKWVRDKLGFDIKPLADNTMRIYCQVDADTGVDPMDPKFGSPPGKMH